MEPVQRGRTFRAEEVSVARRETGGRRRARGEQGLTLIEVIVASVMILLIFVPVSNFLATGDRVIANSQSNRVLSAVANSEVTTVLQGKFPPPSFLTTWRKPAAWPSCTAHPALCPSGTQDSVRWSAVMTGGWCVLKTSGWGNGTVAATTVPTYHVAVKVTAPEGQSGTARALASGEFPVATGGGPPAVGDNVVSCPLGLN